MNGLMMNPWALAGLCVLLLILVWICFSAFIVTIICMNSSQLSQDDEPFKDLEQLARERRLRRPK